MTEPSPDKIIVSTIGTVICAAIGLLPGGLTGVIWSASLRHQRLGLKCCRGRAMGNACAACEPRYSLSGPASLSRRCASFW